MSNAIVEFGPNGAVLYQCRNCKVVQIQIGPLAKHFTTCRGCGMVGGLSLVPSVCHVTDVAAVDGVADSGAGKPADTPGGLAGV